MQSTGSFFHDKSITLGSLIGVTSILELSRRSLRGRKAEDNCKEKKNTGKSRIWFFSLCSRNSTDAEIVNSNGPSLGQFLAVERKAANNCRRNQMSPNMYGPDEFSVPQHVAQPNNSLFVDGRVAPPQSSPLCSTELVERGINDAELEHGIGNGIPLLFSCMCGQHSR